MQVDFYQLSRDPVEQVLPAIAQRLIDDGARLLVVDGREGALARLSRGLWSWKPDSFLAHGFAVEEAAEAQPILLSEASEALNGARHIAMTDGVWRDAALQFERAFLFFDQESIEGARASWRTLTRAEDVSPRFWRQDGRKWVEGP